MPEPPTPKAAPVPAGGPASALHRRTPAMATVGLVVGAAGVAWGCLGRDGVLDAGVSAAPLLAVVSGTLLLVGVGAWLVRRSLPAGLVANAVADLVGGEAAPALLRITRTRAFPADAWNLLLDGLADGTLAGCSATPGGGDRGGEAPASAGEASTDALGPAFEAVHHGLLVLSHDGTVERANGAAARLLRADRETLPGRTLDEIVGDGELAGRAAAVAGGLERRGGSVELPADEESGSILRATLRPLRSGRPGRSGGSRSACAGALLLLEDVTQQRASDRARDLFVAQASHELRAPLTNIQLHAERAIDLGTAPGAEAAAERAECLNHVNGEVLRLARLIDEVLSVSQIKAGSLSAARNDVAWGPLLGKVVAEHEAAAKRRGQTLELDAEPTLPVLQGDREKLSMLLHNLVGNAVKYGRRDGRTRVRATADELFLEVRVADDGPGIAVEEREKIFEPFFRGTHDPGEGEEAPEGTGLGLPLAAEVAQLHEGTLVVEAGEGGVGSCFVLRIPVRSGSAADRIDAAEALAGPDSERRAA